MRADLSIFAPLTGVPPRGGRAHASNSAGAVFNPRHRMRRRSSAARGFTLIEVLATLLLLAITLPAVMYGFSVSTQAAAMARHRSEAGALAESKLNELIATGVLPSGSQTGSFDAAPDYQWTATLSPWGQSGQGVLGTNYVQELDVTVSWNAPSAQSITVTTLVYQSPNASGTTDLSGGLP